MGESVSRNFIERIIDSDIESGKNDGRVVTRFPPEPNGYLHIGHAKSINLNFGLARQYGGRCHLRFDDTNPVKEDMEYINSIMEDIRWLGFDWGEHLYFASSYFDQLYRWAVDLIQAGKAYVDDSSVEEIRCARGTLTEPGTESPFRNRTIEENLDLFRRMKDFPTVPRYCGPKSIWQRRISICAIRLCTAFFIPNIRKRDVNGAFIRCMIGPTDWKTQ